MTFSDQPAWYCLKAQPKRERTAAMSLRALDGVEVLFPQVRYRRQGAAAGRPPTLEPLFPNYLFARFSPLHRLKAVGYARGVAYVVRRGEELVRVPASIVGELSALAPADILDLPLLDIRAGENIRIIAGIFKGNSADVVRLVPGVERVRLLLDILGRGQEIELSLNEVERRYGHPLSCINTEGS
ncbi:MAG: transcription termination/antitermination NusG family protein [Verrucomicrobiota bacterium JB024]|nr:transcription termination/antitermination NusG family protein [Verrucomicrobiota bacterium JB024]